VISGCIDSFKEYAGECITDVNTAWMANKSDKCNNSSPEIDTWLAPLIQMGLFKIEDAENAAEMILSTTEASDKIVISSGYFNLVPKYINPILTSKAEFLIMTAAPEVTKFIHLQTYS